MPVLAASRAPTIIIEIDNPPFVQNNFNFNYFTIALFATLLEQFSVLGVDNFIVPISSAFFFNFFITN